MRVFDGSISSIPVVTDASSVPWFTHDVLKSAYMFGTAPRADAYFLPFSRGSSAVASENCAFNASRSSAKATSSASNAHLSESASKMPIFRAPIDSGCTATCTNRLDMLINTRPCNELFKIADGKSSVCTAMGDMPVLAKDSTGKLFRFVLTDVRYVPDFKYTLIAVKQIWKEHRIDSVFADANKLVFPSGESVPFDARFRLPVITLVSEPLILE